MKQTVTLTRREAFEMLTPMIHLARGVVPSKGEKPDELRRFAYYAGRNLQLLQRLDRETDKLQGALFKHEDAEYSAYDKARIKLGEEHARKDKTGQPVLVQRGNQQPVYSMAPKKARQFEEAHEKLRKRYAAAIERREELARKIEGVGDQSVTLELFTWDYKALPKRISGAYIAVIHPMLFNRPDQVES